jgi:23S rRNA pseudouridine1911/1915/1917 synthase
MDIKIIYEDNDLLVVDKPAGLVVFPEGQTKDNTLIDYLVEKYPKLKLAGEAPRYGIVHRLDKDTSGVLLVAKTQEALIFLQKKFINRDIEKKYIALVCGEIKDDFGEIKTLIGRAKNDPRKQKVFLQSEVGSEGKREAITHYKVIKKYQGYTLLDVKIDTGRRHQIRCHFTYIHHPIAGDKLYKYRDNKSPENLQRQFLHASYIKVELPNGEIKEFKSELPEELSNILNNLKLIK